MWACVCVVFNRRPLCLTVLIWQSIFILPSSAKCLIFQSADVYENKWNRIKVAFRYITASIYCLKWETSNAKQSKYCSILLLMMWFVLQRLYIDLKLLSLAICRSCVSSFVQTVWEECKSIYCISHSEMNRFVSSDVIWIDKRIYAIWTWRHSMVFCCMYTSTCSQVT